MIHHAIWDFDGTLFDTYPVMVRAFRAALAQLDCPRVPEEAEILAQMKQTMDAAYRSFVTGGLTVETFNAVYRPLRMQKEREEAAPFPGALRLCRALVAAGGRNYIVTHRSQTTFPLLGKHGLTDGFADVVTASDGFPRKPAPDAIVYLLEKHGIDRGDAIMLGDRELDVLAGKNAGIHTCLLAQDGPVESCAEAVVRDFAEMSVVIGVDEDIA